MIDVDELAQEIRRVDGNHDKGAVMLAEALMPFLERVISASPAGVKPLEDAAIDALMIGAHVNQAAHNVLLKHTGMEGGCPRVDWYKLRNEIAEAMNAAIDYLPARIMSAIEPAGVVKRIEPTYTQAEYDEAYELGKRDGYSEAVQQIDQLTGGDGEYRYCSDHDPERHTPGPAEMIQRIVDRFETLNLIDDASKTGRDQEWGMSAIEPAGVGVETRAEKHVRGEVTHEDICNTREGGPCNCDWSAAESGIHPDDLAVDRFAAAMKAKLAKKRDEGRGGWEDKERCSNAFLSDLLLEHVAKGDPVDVGNLAMMVHQRGESICVLTERVAAISQLHAIVDAWEALPGGRQVRNSDVEHWLAKHMGPGIDDIRGFLRRSRPDGILPPPPQPRASVPASLKGDEQ